MTDQLSLDDQPGPDDAPAGAPVRRCGGVIATSDWNPATNPWADLGCDKPGEVPPGDLAEVTRRA